MSDFIDQIANLSPKRLALLALELHAELDAMRQAQTEPIAVVGMGCRFPGGADSPEAFWQLLRDGVDTVTEVPAERWDLEHYYDPDPDAPGKMYSRYGAFLAQVDRFDAHFFGIAPREAAQMDPQQRLVLEVAWEALEHAGQAPSSLAGSLTGVFIGVCAYDYSLLQLVDPGRIETYTSSGAAPSIVANRLSYLLDLQGPSLAVDTACSSSLVSVHLACQSLRQKECDLALAGGVNLILSPAASIALSKGRMLAADGRCKTFDARADGYVRGEGCGLMVLKRLSDAMANGDSIWALIRGSAINQDGYGNGLTAPNLLAQQAVMRRALEQAQVSPDQVGYIEAHGTGTALGDPIEVDALRATYGGHRLAGRPCALGSVKTNIGHLEGAAGIAGLIKVVLALRHQAIPPHLHFRQLNPHISLDHTPFVIPTTMQAWPAGDEPRYAGVSSFGFGGTNAHIILSESPHPVSGPSLVERPLHILSLSAKSEAALQDLAQRYTEVSAEMAEPAAAEDRVPGTWPEVCFTANTGRSHFAERLAVVADSASVARDKLAAVVAGDIPAGVLRGRLQGARGPKVAFLFTGQGAQYVGMGRQLYASQPTFRAVLDRCDALLRSSLAQPLLSVLYPEPGEHSPLDQTAYTQPALFALEYALAELWRSWGVEPAAVLGHSIGEYVAACVAGVFSLEDGLRLMAARGRLMQTLPPNGAMAAVFVGEAEVLQAIDAHADEVAIAALNSPTETVISGTRTGLQEVLGSLQAKGIKSRPLAVSHAFHSALMAPILDDLEAIAGTIAMAEPRLGFIANLSGRTVGRGTLTQARYWRQQARQPVRFAPGVGVLYDQGYRLFVEIGPQPVLLGAGQQCVPDDRGIWLASLRRGVDDWQQLLTSLGLLYAQGGNVDWRGFDADYHRRRVSLPTYPFQRQQYQIARQIPSAATGSAALEFNGHPGPTPPMSDWLYEVQWQPRALPRSLESRPDVPHGRWLILADRGGIGSALAERLEAHGEACVLILPGTAYEKVAAQRWIVDPASAEDFRRLLVEAGDDVLSPWRGVVYLWSLDATASEQSEGAAVQADGLLSCGSVLHVVQALITTGGAHIPRLWLVTRGVQSVGVTTVPSEVAQAPLWGLGRVIALEHPELSCTGLDLDPTDVAAALPMLVEELMAADREDQIAWCDSVRYVARLVRRRGGSATVESLCVHADAPYLITGGLGSLGLEVARWLVEQGARHLVLLGRRAATAGSRSAIQALEQAGAQVTTMQADVAQAADMVQVLDTLRRTHPPLRGIVHAAGILDDGVVLQQTWERFAAVLAPKVAGAWNLHLLTQDLPLDFMVFFSSMASILGSPGQGNYAAANAFLDALAHHRRACRLPALSINWGPWAASGMAAATTDRQQRRRMAQGMDTIMPEQGLQVLQWLLRDSPAQAAVLPVEWSRYLQAFDADDEPPLLANLARRPASPPGSWIPAAERAQLRRRLSEAPASTRQELIREQVRAQAIAVLGLDPAYALDPHKPLKEFGLDSLMAIDLAKVLGADIGQRLPATLIFNHSTVDAIAEYLLAELFPRPAVPVPHQPPQEDDKQARLLAEVRQLSEHELDAFVRDNSGKLMDRP